MSITTHMANGFASFSHPTYNDIAAACKHIAEFIHFNASAIGKVNTIVGLSRGGLTPAVELSNIMNIPMVAIHYSSKVGKGDKHHTNELPDFKGKSILLVDDICDSGNTLKELHEEYQSRGYNVFSAVIYHKTQADQIYTPDVWAINISQNFGWVVFPWENN